MTKFEGTIAITGNPNSGKSTIFNALTGSKQVTGNWPGVTVEKKEGVLELEDRKIRIVDLPGIYSLSANSIDERIARDFIVNKNPDIVVIVMDASNIERNLYLYTEIAELNPNVIIVLNMMDQAVSNGLIINTKELENILGAKIVITIANKGRGIKELKRAIFDYKSQSKNDLRIFKDNNVINAVKEVANIISGKTGNYSSRYVAIRLLEGDYEFYDLLKNKDIIENIEKVRLGLENKIGKDFETYIAEKRYAFIHGVYKECVEEKIDINRRITLSDKIDSVVTNRFLGIPIFLIMLWLSFVLVFKVGNPVADLIDQFFGFLGDKTAGIMMYIHSPLWFISLIKDGIIAGVGSVLVFFPNIFIMFLIFAFMEDSGYLARAAFVMDKLMHKIGLHGKSFIPLILGFGCNVPAIMATRTLENEKDRIITILINPLMSCSARLPIYLLLTGIFFKRNQGFVVLSLYLTGIILAMLVAIVLKRVFFKHKTAPLIMELPPYRLPSFNVVVKGAWNRSEMFLKKAGTIIIGGVVVVWLLSYFPFGCEYGSGSSYIGLLGKFMAPIFKPAGFGFWQASVSLLFGVIAKEIVVGTFGTLFGGANALSSVLPHYFSPLSAYSFMLMSLIYFPCLASIGAIKQEAGGKWAVFAVTYSLLLGYIVAVLFFQIGSLFVH